MENDEFLEVENELQDGEDPSETTEAITFQDFQTFNLNVCTGFLYVVGALGVVCGAIVCNALKGVFRR